MEKKDHVFFDLERREQYGHRERKEHDSPGISKLILNPYSLMTWVY